MEHEDFQSEIPAYLAARLDAEGRSRLEVHLLECDSCADTVSVARDFLNTLEEGADGVWAEHPTVQQIRELAIGPVPAGGGGFAAHLAVCPTCTLEVETWRGRLQPGKRLRDRHSRTDSERSRIGPLLTGLAAGLILGFALTALLVMRGLLFPSMSVGRHGGLASNGPGSAPPHPQQLDLPYRGESSVNVLRIVPNEPSVLLIVPAEFPRPGGGGAKFTIEILDSSGDVAWTAELSSEDLTALTVPGTARLALVVPSQSLPIGDCELIVRPTGAGSDPVQRIPFRTRR